VVFVMTGLGALPAIGFAALSLLAAPPVSDDAMRSTVNDTKKHAYRLLKARERTTSPTRVGREADRPVFARNLRTHEIAAISGPAAVRSTEARSSFFRCWFTEEPGPLPPKLVHAVVSAATEFRTREVRVISAFRAPKYNLLLRKKGREVARRSQHTRANAIDFYLPGVDTRALYDHLLAKHPGGVGFYPVSSFVHVDLGPKRTWQGT
jgi:uncharacterized protein YcbK (DUF882 family)